MVEDLLHFTFEIALGSMLVELPMEIKFPLHIDGTAACVLDNSRSILFFGVKNVHAIRWLVQIDYLIISTRPSLTIRLITRHRNKSAAIITFKNCCKSQAKIRNHLKSSDKSQSPFEKIQ
jgi:hypothetical protein